MKRGVGNEREGVAKDSEQSKEPGAVGLEKEGYYGPVDYVGCVHKRR